jgi:hypothetical protein
MNVDVMNLTAGLDPTVRGSDVLFRCLQEAVETLQGFYTMSLHCSRGLILRNSSQGIHPIVCSHGVLATQIVASHGSWDENWNPTASLSDEPRVTRSLAIQLFCSDSIICRWSSLTDLPRCIPSRALSMPDTAT